MHHTRRIVRAVPPPQPGSEAAAEQQIAAAYKDLNPASFAWRPPAKAKVNHTQPVTFRIAPKGAPSNFSEGMSGSGTVEQWSGTVSARVRAQLVGPGFTIDPKDPVQHILLPGQTAEWQWFVTPTESGNQTLQLVTELVLDVNGREETYPFYRNAMVDVAPDPIGWAEEHWEWIFGTLLIPLAGALWKWWRGRRSAAAAPAEAE